MATGYRGTSLQPVQTGYFDSPYPGYAGQIASAGDPALIDGFPVEDVHVGRWYQLQIRR